MKLLYLTDQVYQHGGAEKILIQKVNYWADVFGYEVALVTSSQKGRQPFFPLSPKVRLHDLGMDYPAGSFFHPRNIGRFRQHYAKLKAFAADFRPDAVFVVSQTLFRYIAPFACRPALSFYEYHTTWYGFKLANDRLPRLVRVKNSVLGAIARYCESRYTRVVFLNRSEFDHYRRPNAVVIPNFFDTSEARVTAEPRNIALALGRLSFPKGYELLIEAWHLVDQNIHGWEMHVYGNGEDKEKLEALLASTNFRNPLRFFAAVDRVNEKLAEASLYVMSSRFETFPMVLLEAMSNGLPVVSFDCPTGPRHILTENEDGLLVEPNNVQALADSVLKLMNDEALREKMGAAGQKNVRRFRAESVMKAWDGEVKSHLRQRHDR